VVQLTVLWALVSVLGWPYLPATAIAVESALLVNFALHERWTWRDRPAVSGGRAARLWRFHLLNGSVSLAGNLLVTATLTGGFGVPPLAANTAAVLACSLVNFAGSDRLVFRST
jgi:putative flippase GtrA